MKQRRQVTRSTIGYVRVSTDEQVSDGVSLAAQEARIRAYSVAMGWDDVEIITDAGESAKSLQRPGMAILLDRVRAGEIERIVCVKLDRVTRSVRDLAEILDLVTRRDVALVSISETLDTSTAVGRLLLNVLGSFAQMEREVIGERTASALSYKRSQGRVYGRTPFGYRREGDALVADPAEQTTLTLMREMDAAGESYRAIAAALEARGILARRGGTRWNASSVRSVLRSLASRDLTAPWRIAVAELNTTAAA